MAAAHVRALYRCGGFKRKFYLRIMRLVVLFFFLFCSLLSRSQGNPYSRILIQAYPAFTSDDYAIDILRYADSTRIYIYLRGEVDYYKLEKDSTVIATRRLLHSMGPLNLRNDTVRRCIKLLDSLTVVYSEFKIDSVTVSNKQDRWFYGLFQDVVDTPTEELIGERKKITDPVNMHFRIYHEGDSREFWVRSPSAKSHFHLFRLINGTTSLYRKERSPRALPKYRTHGY